MKRPLLPVVLFYLGGILLAELAHSFGITLSVAWLLGGLVVGSLGALAWTTFRRSILALTLIIAGSTALELQTAILSPRDLRLLAPAEDALVSVRGHLLESPIHRIYSHQDEVSHRTQAKIEIDSIRWRDGDWQPVDGHLITSTAGVIGAPFYSGTAVELRGVLRRPPEATTPGGFDYAAYLRRHGIYFQLRCSSTNDWQQRGLAGDHPPLADRFGTWAMGVLARGLPVEDEPLQLLWAMTLGWQTALTGEVSEPFMRSGTMHVFAISGLHIALIASLLAAMLRVFRIPRPICALIVLPLIWAYTGATGWQASAIRSTVMTSVIVGSWLLPRPSDLLNSLCAAGLVILVWDPQQLFQASFQLSFGVVLSLALIGPWLDAHAHRLIDSDPWIPEARRPTWQRWVRPSVQYLLTSLTVSLAAWIGSAPMVAAYFNLVTPISLLANLVIVPLSSGALACSLGSLLVGPVIPFAGELLNHSAWFFMWLMVRASELAAATPAGCFQVPTPSPITILLYYGLVAAVIGGAFQQARARKWCAAGLGTAALIWLGLQLRDRQVTQLVVIPMNGGSAAHFTSPSRQSNWLIDCGDAGSAGFVLKPYLRSQGVNRIENLLITHGDTHHVGGASVLSQAFPIDHAWFGPVTFRSVAYREAQGLLAQPAGRSQTLHRNQRIAPWLVLHPDDTDHFSQADDNAIVLFAEIEGTRLLLLSDLGKPGQNRLLSRYPELRADIVVTGIPRQTEPVADLFLDVLRPRLILVTDAEYPASQRASHHLRERLAGHGIPVLYTSECGAISIRFRRNAWHMDTTRPIPPPALPVPASVEAPPNDDDDG